MSVVVSVTALNEAERFDRFIPIGKRRFGPVPNWPDKKYAKGGAEFSMIASGTKPKRGFGWILVAVGTIFFLSALVVGLVYALQSKDDKNPNTNSTI